MPGIGRLVTHRLEPKHRQEPAHGKAIKNLKGCEVPAVEKRQRTIRLVSVGWTAAMPPRRSLAIDSGVAIDPCGRISITIRECSAFRASRANRKLELVRRRSPSVPVCR